MKINDILTLHNTAASARSETKKSTLELISKLAVSHVNALETRQVLSYLITREKLGSTAVGHGVALPHARVKGIEKPIGVLVTLNKPIDFDAPDNEPVDILFGLLIPEHAHEEHLNTLAMLAEKLSIPQYRAKLRHAHNTDELYATAITETNEQH